MNNVMDFEQMISMSKVSCLLPGHPHPVTIRRWSRQGLRGIRLGSWKVGSRRYTTREAVEAFIAAITGATSLESNVELVSGNPPANMSQSSRGAQ